MFIIRGNKGKIERIGIPYGQASLYNRIYTAEDIRDAYCGIKRFENPRTPAPLHVILMFNKLLRGCLITF